MYSEDGSAFLLLAAVQEGGGQYYTHIKHVDVLRQRIAVLSHGKVEVAEILAWDQENHLVYYLGKWTIILYLALIILILASLLNANFIFIEGLKEKTFIPKLHLDMVKEINQIKYLDWVQLSVFHFE